MATQEEIQEQEQRKEIEVPEATLADFVGDMRSEITTCISNRATWSTEQAKWYQWRKGITGAKTDATKPWKGSSNIHYRLEEKAIREFKATGVDSVMQAQRLTRFIHPSESADKLENYFETELRTKRDWAAVCTAELDTLGERGQLFTKQVWRCESDPRTETCEREKFINPLLQAAMVKATDPLTGRPDFTKFGDGKHPMAGIRKVLPIEEIRGVVARVVGYPYGLDAESDKDSVYLRRINSILVQLDGDDDVIEYIEDIETFNGFDVSVIRDPNMLLWGPRKSVDIQQAEWICHRMRYSERDLLRKSKKNGGPYKNVEEILKALSGADDGSKKTTAPEYSEETYAKTSKNLYEGVQDNNSESGFVNVWEIYCYVPRKWIRRMKGMTLEDGDTMVKAILTICPDADADIGVMRLIEFPYKFKTSKARWNFCSHTMNKGAGDLYSGEGIPKLINPFSAAYNIAQNALSDRNTVAINPWVLVNANSGITENQLRQFPQIIKVDSPSGTVDGAVSVVPFPNLGFFATEVQQYAVAANELAGRANLAPLQAYPEAPTAEQVQQTVAPANAVSRFELTGYHEFKANQYRQLYDLLWQFKGEDLQPEGETVAVPDQKGKTITLLPEDFKSDFAILSGADLLRDNPVLAAQKRVAGAQMLLSDPRMAPFFSMYELANVLINDNFGFIYGSRIGVSVDKAKQNEIDMANLKQAAEQQLQLEMEGQTKKNKKVKSFANSQPVASGPMAPGGGSGNIPRGMFNGAM